MSDVYSPFQQNDLTVKIATPGTTDGVGVALWTNGAPVNNVQQCRVFNACSVPVFVNFSATTTDPDGQLADLPVAAGAERVFSVPAFTKYAFAAVKTGTGSDNVYFTMGVGF
jgi:hypothetical protein